MEERDRKVQDQGEQRSRQDAEQSPPTTAERDRFQRELQKDVLLVAPMALRMPISLVRSVTETSMIFHHPHARPTIRPTEETRRPSNRRSPPVSEFQ